MERAKYDMDCWENQFRGGGLLELSLPKLTLGCVYLQLENFQQSIHWLNQGVAGLHATGRQDITPFGLLSRAALHRHTQNFPKAHQDLQEVLEIAEPSGMRLHLTDYHLEMARLLLAESNDKDATHHIQQAADLITKTDYHRRDAELLELQQAINPQDQSE